MKNKSIVLRSPLSSMFVVVCCSSSYSSYSCCYLFPSTAGVQYSEAIQQ
jgi:hypothetical protein